jgi:hypothetical protein
MKEARERRRSVARAAGDEGGGARIHAGRTGAGTEHRIRTCAGEGAEGHVHGRDLAGHRYRRHRRHWRGDEEDEDMDEVSVLQEEGIAAEDLGEARAGDLLLFELPEVESSRSGPDARSRG